MHMTPRIRGPQEEQFMLLLQSGKLAECARLVEGGVDVNFRDNNGCTPLFQFCTDSKVEVARMLIDSGADVNITNVRGNTPLHEACRNGSKEAVVLLILSGTNPDMRNIEGKKAEELNPSMRTLIQAIIEVLPAYQRLSEVQRTRLKNVFQEVKGEGSQGINLEKCIRFNRYLEDVPLEEARRDAQVFIRDVHISHPGIVNQEEWMISFAKLGEETGMSSVDQFLDEFDQKVKERGEFEKYKARD